MFPLKSVALELLLARLLDLLSSLVALRILPSLPTSYSKENSLQNDYVKK